MPPAEPGDHHQANPRLFMWSHETGRACQDHVPLVWAVLRRSSGRAVYFPLVVSPKYPLMVSSVEPCEFDGFQGTYS